MDKTRIIGEVALLQEEIEQTAGDLDIEIEGAIDEFEAADTSPPQFLQLVEDSIRIEVAYTLID